MPTIMKKYLGGLLIAGESSLSIQFIDDAKSSITSCILRTVLTVGQGRKLKLHNFKPQITLKAPKFATKQII